jgi:hypothetical protein
VTTDPQRLVILGASGDLTTRLLLPGLGMLLATDHDRHVEVGGAGRIIDQPPGGRLGNALVRTRRGALPVMMAPHVQVDITERGASRLSSCRTAMRPCSICVPPAITRIACEHLSRGDRELRLALEKPFGDSPAASREFALLACFRAENRARGDYSRRPGAQPAGTAVVNRLRADLECGPWRGGDPPTLASRTRCQYASASSTWRATSAVPALVMMEEPAFDPRRVYDYARPRQAPVRASGGVATRQG